MVELTHALRNQYNTDDQWKEETTVRLESWSGSEALSGSPSCLSAWLSENLISGAVLSTRLFQLTWAACSASGTPNTALSPPGSLGRRVREGTSSSEGQLGSWLSLLHSKDVPTPPCPFGDRIPSNDWNTEKQPGLNPWPLWVPELSPFTSSQENQSQKMQKLSLWENYQSGQTEVNRKAFIFLRRTGGCFSAILLKVTLQNINYSHLIVSAQTFLMTPTHDISFWYKSGVRISWKGK